MNSKELWKEVDRILWEEWDPIGVNDYGGPDDEYRSYVPSIVKLIQENADEIKIRKQLHQHANVNMGLSSSLDSHAETSERLNKLKTVYNTM